MASHNPAPFVRYNEMRRQRTVALTSRVVALASMGYSRKEIAFELDFSYAHVNTLMHRAGWRAMELAPEEQALIKERRLSRLAGMVA